MKVSNMWKGLQPYSKGFNAQCCVVVLCDTPLNANGQRARHNSDETKLLTDRFELKQEGQPSTGNFPSPVLLQGGLHLKILGDR